MVSCEDCVVTTLFSVQRSAKRSDTYSSQSSLNDPAEKRLRTDQRTGLDCIKQEYQEHLPPAADYQTDPTKRLTANTPQQMPPAVGQYGHGADQTSGFGPSPANQPTAYGYWPTSQADTRSESHPTADLWPGQQQVQIKQEYSSGYPEPGFPQHQQQQDYSRSGFGNQSMPNTAYPQEWNQAYGQSSSSQIPADIPIPGQPPLVDASAAYVTDPAMMAGTAQWGFPGLSAIKVEPGIAPSTVPYGGSTSVPPPPLRPPTGPPTTVPTSGLPPFSQFGVPAQPPGEFRTSASAPPSMRLPPPQPPVSGQHHLPETGGYGGQSWNSRIGGEQKSDFGAGRQSADGSLQPRPKIPSLLSDEQINAMRTGGSERATDVGDRGRDFCLLYTSDAADE